MHDDIQALKQMPCSVLLGAFANSMISSVAGSEARKAGARGRAGARFRPRKAFLNIGCHANQLVGVGGPGAPHHFCLQRFQDTGCLASKYICITVIARARV